MVLLEGSWNDEFINQITGFPNAKHDEYVDLGGYIAEFYNRSAPKMYQNPIYSENLI